MGNSGRKRVDILGADDVPAVVSVLSESFFDYPLMPFILGPGPDYPERLDRLVTFFVMARVLRGETLFGLWGEGGLSAAALVSRPGSGPTPPGLARVREETWAALGADARSRYESHGAAAAPLVVAADHIHLNMIGVRPSAQGTGRGRALLEAVHALSASDESSAGVSLTTEVESNVSLYERFGYEVVGSAPIGPALTTWMMFRRDA